jgi:hypothetical protein
MARTFAWTATAGWWNLRTDELFLYLRTRFGSRIGLLVVLLLLGSLAELPAILIDLGVRAVLAATLVAQFRLWDDLADRERDRREHPDRILPRATSLVPFHVLLAAAFAANVGLLVAFRPVWTVVLFLALNAVLLAWYGRLRGWVNRPRVHSLVLLLKYPAFVVLLAGVATLRLLAAAALVYLILCVYEFLHDLRPSRVP